MKTMCKLQQEQITPHDALRLLSEGNQRFVNNLRLNRNLLKQVNETQEGQHPFAVIISCMDSRTSAELIFDQGLGDIFSIRIAGNVINDEIIGSSEFGCKVFGAKIIVVVGHVGCGAINGALEKVQLGKLHTVLQRIQRCVPTDAEFALLDQQQKLDIVTEYNVRQGIIDLQKNSSIIAELEQEDKLIVVGAIYDVSTGAVSFLSQEN